MKEKPVTNVVQLNRQLSLKESVVEINKKFTQEADSNNKADRCRLAAGRMLLDLRKRIESGEAGSVNWWAWYESQSFVRSRKDAEKVMAIARAAEPVAAEEIARAKNAAHQQAHRERAAYISGRHQSYQDRDPAPVRGVEADDIVEHALRLVEQMDEQQRTAFFAKVARLRISK
jgi:hypothetical protein